MQLLQLAGPSASGWLFSAVNLGLPSYAGTGFVKLFIWYCTAGFSGTRINLR